MTDYTKLIERLIKVPVNVQDWKTIGEVKAAIEALQEENALLEGTLESRERNIAEMQAENERLKSSLFTANRNNIRLVTAHLDQEEKTLAERDALQSQLDAMGKGEPVAYSVGNTLKWHEGKGMTNAQLYAAPKALAPLKDEPWMVKAIDEAYGIGGTP